jgi:2-polyprenyl-3-methyl-5-hydroxy-6-metoxy-1,4-benzoquinol methylase
MEKWDFGQLPFVYTQLQQPSDIFLPFCLELNLETGLIIQSPNNDVIDALKRVYVESSRISGMMDDKGIGKEYANDFLSYIVEQSGIVNFSSCRVLDIGCGTGYLLHLLQEMGAEGTGLEPGFHGQDGATRFGVPIVRDFFPSDAIKGKFDLIIGFGLLEHISCYEDFFSHIMNHLKDDGRVVLAVPNCEPYLSSGDISLLFHEHWSYFTDESLIATIRKYSGLDTSVDKAKFGGSIYSTSRRCLTSLNTPYLNLSHSLKLYDSFTQKLQLAAQRVYEIFSKAERSGKEVGVFVPGRVVNILATLKNELRLTNVRFFDDNETLHGTYFPGFNIPVESRQALIAQPPDKIIIMSHTFSEKILGQLRDEKIESEIITWGEIFSELC